MSEITFTVEGVTGTFRYNEKLSGRGFVFGSLLGENGVARKGRPSKFPADKVTTSAPLPEVKPETVESAEVVSEPEVTVKPVVDEKEAEREKSESFLPLE